MSEFGGMEELLQDFLTESSDMLSDVDNKLVELEKRPDDKTLLNDIFRGFHTIKGGAGFLNVDALVTLCHRTENLFDKLRNGEMKLSAGLLDYILASTGVVREMFGELAQKRQPHSAPQALLDSLDAVLEGRLDANPAPAAPAAPAKEEVKAEQVSTPPAAVDGEPDWNKLYHGLLGTEPAAPAKTETVQAKAALEVAPVKASEPVALAPSSGAFANTGVSSMNSGQQIAQQLTTQETTIRIDTNRLDQVLNLSGEIGLTKNRLTTLRTDILQGRSDAHTLRALDEAIGQLDLLVSDLQNAVMKTRMQPIGRLFQKYPRLARDLARQLGKDVELVITGEETELDKTMIEDLNDPLVHLVRNAVDHGIETKEERLAIGKSEKSLVQLAATQVGDHILIEITDDGKGMKPEMIRQKAIEKGLLKVEDANNLDDKQSLQLIFLPGFSTKDQISSVSGRGVGMDVVKTNIQKMNGRIDIQSIPGEGSRFTISLPLTLAILPVLVVKVCDQPFAVPLAMVREIIPLSKNDIQQVSGKATMVVRDEILSVRSLASLIGWHDNKPPSFGVLMQSAESSFVLAIDTFVGRDDVVIKPLQNIKPKGIAGATLSGDGSVVLVLDMEDLLAALGTDQASPLFDFA
ncbi:chemotaxis protein CheA [Leeia oryzae]|uniref:chemotaxis protein CheA n=1 Tax=Leeia oryzae TaxID=356662 RepID=UPI00037FB295|nr:chemotaxis protein CheA [Leeia oryzae]